MWGVLALVLLSSCSPDDSLSVRLSDLEQVRFDPGYHRATVGLSSGIDLPIVTYSPAVTSTSKLPLIVVLHGGGQTGTYQGEPILGSLFRPGLEELRAVFVAPTAVAGHWSTEPAQEMVDALVDGILKAGWPVDPDRIVVAGYSAGAMGVWVSAARHDRRYRAGVAIAGDPVIHSLDDTDIMPLYVIHSRMDEVFPYDGVEQDVSALQQAGAPVHLETVEDIGHTAIAAYVPGLQTALPWLDAHLQ